MDTKDVSEKPRNHCKYATAEERAAAHRAQVKKWHCAHPGQNRAWKLAHPERVAEYEATRKAKDKEIRRLARAAKALGTPPLVRDSLLEAAKAQLAALTALVADLEVPAPPRQVKRKAEGSPDDDDA